MSILKIKWFYFNKIWD